GQEAWGGGAPRARTGRAGATDHLRRSVGADRGLCHAPKEPSISSAAVSAASWAEVPPSTEEIIVPSVLAPSTLPQAGATGTALPPSSIWVAKAWVSSSPASTTSVSASSVPGTYDRKGARLNSSHVST